MGASGRKWGGWNLKGFPWERNLREGVPRRENLGVG